MICHIRVLQKYWLLYNGYVTKLLFFLPELPKRMLSERKHTFSILDEFHWVKVIVSILLQKYHRHRLLQQMLGDLPFLS